MPTIPDDHLSHHDREALMQLRRRYGANWQIGYEPAGLPVFTAEHRSADGRAIRYLVGHTIAELTARLESALTVEP